MLPKELLNDLEKGNRTKEMLEIKEDEMAMGLEGLLSPSVSEIARQYQDLANQQWGIWLGGVRSLNPGSIFWNR